MFKLSIRITWPLIFLLLLALLAYLMREQPPARRIKQPGQRPTPRAQMIINLAAEGRDRGDTADLDREVLDTVRHAQTESPFAEYARQFKHDGEKRRAAYTRP